MDSPDELIGLWDSALYDYGAMESTEVALLPDGTGWSTWMSAGGGMELILLTWSRSGPGELTVTELELSSGLWESDQPGRVIKARPPRVLHEVNRYRYELVWETPPLASGPGTGLSLDRPLMFAEQFALVRRDITAADRPTVVRSP